MAFAISLALPVFQMHKGTHAHDTHLNIVWAAVSEGDYISPEVCAVCEQPNIWETVGRWKEHCSAVSAGLLLFYSPRPLQVCSVYN